MLVSKRAHALSSPEAIRGNVAGTPQKVVAKAARVVAKPRFVVADAPKVAAKLR
jgi:hypothetical protein